MYTYRFGIAKVPSDNSIGKRRRRITSAKKKKKKKKAGFQPSCLKTSKSKKKKQKKHIMRQIDSDLRILSPVYAL